MSLVRRVVVAPSVAVLCMWMHGSATAVDPRGFAPPPSGAAVLGLDTTRLGADLAPFVTLVASLADDEVPGEASRLTTALALGIVLAERLELGAGIAWIQGHDEAWPGDARLAAKLRLTTRDAPLGVALALTASLPTADAAHAGDDGLALDPRLVLDWRAADVIVAATLGYRVRPSAMIGAVHIDDELRFGAAVEGRVTRALALVGELDGSYGLEAEARALSLEARLGARVRLGPWSLAAAAGTRLTDGYGAPDARLVIVLGYGPAPLGARPGGSDAQGPTTFGPPPPVDLALVLAADPDADADGVPTPDDRCPSAPEDVDRHADEDGCPDPDDDEDGVADADDRCPEAREVVNGVMDDDGCPDVVPGAVAGAGATSAGPTIGPDGRIALPGVIEFRSGSDVLLAEAEAVLGQVARFLLANPDIARVRIEGHTDDLGDEEENVDLSERRAASVRRALVARGVAADRLLPKGFGKTRPVTAAVDTAARRQNRRVELRVMFPGGGP